MTRIHPPPVLGTRRLRSRCSRAALPPEAPGEGPSCLFQLLGAPGVPGLVAASLPSLPLSSRGFSSVSVSLLFCLLEGPCHWMQDYPPPGGAHLRPFPSFHPQRPCLRRARPQVSPRTSLSWRTQTSPPQAASLSVSFLVERGATPFRRVQAQFLWP